MRHNQSDLVIWRIRLRVMCAGMSLTQREEQIDLLAWGFFTRRAVGNGSAQTGMQA